MKETLLRRIGKYDIIDVLGRGGMGVVYRAKDLQIGRTVAIKTLRGSFTDSPEMLQRFYREAQTGGSLHHPNIATIYDLGDMDGMPYIVMEFIEGEPLAKLIKSETKLSLVDKLTIIEQVCLGLGYAHKRGVVHRDVKPANIIVQPDGNPKIVDFGIARLANSERDEEVTQVGQIVGSVGYMAPERLRNEPVDGRADIFSTGVALYQFLTGELPFSGEDFVLMQKILNEPHTPLRVTRSAYPIELDKVLDRALAKKPEERYQTAEEFAASLRAIADNLKGQISELLSEADLLQTEKRFDRAREVLLQVQSIDPDNNRAGQLLVDVQQNVVSGSLQQAESLLPAGPLRPPPPPPPTPISSPGEFTQMFQTLQRASSTAPPASPRRDAARQRESRTSRVEHDNQRQFGGANPGVTELGVLNAPTGFFGATIVSRTRFFEGDQVRYSKIQETLRFYRDHLNRDYQSLSDQAKFTYYLWVASVCLGLVALASGMILLFEGNIRAGSMTTISAAFVYFIQRVFQQREDHYRGLASDKHKVLEYGNHWLLVIQSIDAIENASERERRQSELVDVLTKKLGAEGARPQNRKSATPRKKPSPENNERSSK